MLLSLFEHRNSILFHVNGIFMEKTLRTSICKITKIFHKFSETKSCNFCLKKYVNVFHL
jgi:hypothetical protein